MRAAPDHMTKPDKSIPSEEPADEKLDRNEPPTYVAVTEAERHYTHLKEYHQTLLTITLTALGIILAAGGAVFWNTMHEVKSSAQQSIVEIPALAEKEAKKRINELLESDEKIKPLINDAARRIVSKAVEEYIANEVAKMMPRLEEQMTEVGRVVDLGIKARIGHRGGLDALLAIQSSESQPAMAKSVAKTLYGTISADYAAMYSLSDWDLAGASFKDHFGGRDPADITIRKELVEKIENSADLGEIAVSVMWLRVVTGIHFGVFDFEAIAKWKREGMPISKVIGKNDQK